MTLTSYQLLYPARVAGLSRLSTQTTYLMSRFGLHDFAARSTRSATGGLLKGVRTAFAKEPESQAADACTALSDARNRCRSRFPTHVVLGGLACKVAAVGFEPTISRLWASRD